MENHRVDNCPSTIFIAGDYLWDQDKPVHNAPHFSRIQTLCISVRYLYVTCTLPVQCLPVPDSSRWRYLSRIVSRLGVSTRDRYLSTRSLVLREVSAGGNTTTGSFEYWYRALNSYIGTVHTSHHSRHSYCWYSVHGNGCL